MSATGNGTDAEADTQSNKTRLHDFERRLRNAEDYLVQLSALHKDVRTMLTATGQLNTTVQTALTAMNARGLRSWHAGVITGAVAIASAALGWMAWFSSGGG